VDQGPAGPRTKRGPGPGSGPRSSGGPRPGGDPGPAVDLALAVESGPTVDPGPAVDRGPAVGPSKKTETVVYAGIQAATKEGFPVMTLKSLGKTANDTWHLEASPQTMSVSRKTMCSSRFGDFLEKHHMLETTLLVGIITASMFWFAHRRFGTTEINVLYTNQQGVTTAAQFQQPHPGLYLAFLVLYALSLFILWHRINRCGLLLFLETPL